MLSVLEAPTGAGASLLGIASAPLDSASTSIAMGSATSALAGGMSTGGPMGESRMRALMNSSTMLRPVTKEAASSMEETALPPVAEESATEEHMLAPQQEGAGEVSSDSPVNSGGSDATTSTLQLTAFVRVLARSLAMRPRYRDGHGRAVDAALHSVGAAGDEV